MQYTDADFTYLKNELLRMLPHAEFNISRYDYGHGISVAWQTMHTGVQRRYQVTLDPTNVTESKYRDLEALLNRAIYSYNNTIKYSEPSE